MPRASRASTTATKTDLSARPGRSPASTAPTRIWSRRSTAAPAFGGTPSDQSVRDLIAELKARGLKVTLYPFVMMDIAAGNALPRSVDRRGAAAGLSLARPHHLRSGAGAGRLARRHGGGGDSGRRVLRRSASDDWNFRQHGAALRRSSRPTAGGVDAFLIGSELRVADARALGLRRLSGGRRAGDACRRRQGDRRRRHVSSPTAPTGPNTARTWSTAARAKCAFRSIRCGRRRRSTPSASTITRRWPTGATTPTISTARSPTSIYDRDYLAGNLAAARLTTGTTPTMPRAMRRRARRSPTGSASRGCSGRRISGISGRNAHYERVGGAELAAPTAWVPQSKPIWLTEFGCPAVDKGANQPSVFPDPKSSESGAAVFLQRRARRPDPAPLPRSRARRARSGLRRERERSIRSRRSMAGAWSSRAPSICGPGTRGPIRHFRQLTDAWSDGANWETGHWLTGRLGAAPLDALVATMLADCGVERRRHRATSATAPDGYVIDRPMAPRAMLEPLALAYCFRCRGRRRRAALSPARRCAGRRARRGRSGAARGAAPASADARAGNRTAARGLASASPISAPTIAARPRRSRRLVGGSARAAHADLAVVTNDTRGASGARKSGCRICGPAARARTSRCRRAGCRSRRATSSG